MASTTSYTDQPRRHEVNRRMIVNLIDAFEHSDDPETTEAVAFELIARCLAQPILEQVHE